MKASKVQELLSKLVQLEKEQSDWIDKLPVEIRESFFDNGYCNALRTQIDNLVSFIFDTWAEDVSYFLYEPAPHKITTEKGEYVINTVEEYVDYMVAERFLQEDRK